MRPPRFWQKMIRSVIRSSASPQVQRLRRTLTVEYLEVRDVPSISVPASSDGIVADRNLDGVYDTVDTSTYQVSDRWFSTAYSTTIGQERPVIEFDLQGLNLPAGTGITSATLEFTVESYTSSTTGPQFNIEAFGTSGPITVADGTAAAKQVGTGTITALGTQDFTLDAASINALSGRTVGIRLENTTINGNWFSFASNTYPYAAHATLILNTGPVSPPVLPPPPAPPPLLSISLSPGTVIESAGAGAATGTVTRTGDLSQPLTLNLSSSDTSGATVPATVTIPINQASATFSINAVDDQLLNDPKMVTISASGTTANIPVGLDPTFGSGGLVQTPLDQSIQFPHEAITTQADGKILAASEDGGGYWQLIRLNPNGTRDSTFGTNGVVQTAIPITNGMDPVPHTIVVQSDGKILVGGAYGSYSQTGVGLGVLVRYNADGSLDTAFGNSGVADLSSIVNDFVTSIAVRPDGRILLGLQESGVVYTRVAQLQANGLLDTSFGSFGVASLNLGYSAEQIVLLANGEFLVGGSFQSNAGVAEVLANGKGLDTSFGTAGKATLNFGSTNVSIAALALDSQGRIVYGASTSPGGYAAGRLTAAGVPDTTFGTNGTTTLNVAGGSDVATSMAIQADDKIVLGGVTIVNGDYDSSLVRFNADGTPDTTFNGTGAFRQSLVNTFLADMIFGISELPDGQLVALTGWANDIRVARFNMADPLPVQASAQLSVQETDVHQVPIINNQAFSIAEGSTNGTTVGTVTASEPNPGLALSYSIVSGNTSGAFAIDASTGAITVANAAALDYEANPVFTLDVRATDNYSTPYSSDATITIDLTDITDPPVVSTATFGVIDNSANGTAVGTVSSTNPDSDDALAFSIIAGNTSGAFAINPTTGAITVANASALNAQTTPVYQLTIQASDAGSPSQSGSATITINVADVTLPPVVSAATFSLSEGSANGTSVGTVSVTDPDSDDSLAYAIVAGNTSGAFTIDPATGAITVANSTALDFETNPVFTLTVQATNNDSTAASGTGTITIDLTDITDPPMVSTATFGVIDNSANGTAVGTVSSTNPDSDDALAFSIIAGNTGGAFAINPTTGVITVANSVALDSETNPTYMLTVQASDAGSPSQSGSATITINVADVSSPPVVSAATFSLAEGSANGTSVGTVSATDPDSDDTLAFSIISGNTGGAFAINAATGAITVANSTALDFETNPVFTLTVQATNKDSIAASGTGTITIDLSDVTTPPVVSAATFSLADNSPNGTAVGTVLSTNPDSDDALAFAITAGNTGGAFAINPTTGAITVANASALNYQTNPVFHLTVQASDAGSPSQSGSATITINLTHVVQPLPVSIQVIGYHNTDRIILGSTTTIQVVIFSTATFDARSIDVNSIRFGATGTEDSLVRNRRGVPQYSYVDVNHDGRLDLVVSITVSKTGLVVGDTQAYLSGLLLNGQMIEGTGAVLVTRKK